MQASLQAQWLVNKLGLHSQVVHLPSSVIKISLTDLTSPVRWVQAYAPHGEIIFVVNYLYSVCETHAELYTEISFSIYLLHSQNILNAVMEQRRLGLWKT